MRYARFLLSKITAQNIKDLGFLQALFSVMAADETAFTALITAVISDKSLELQGRIGTTAYDDATVPRATYVKLAEKYLAAAEMVQRRINIVLGTRGGTGDPPDTRSEQQQRKDYLDQAEVWIAKVAQSVTTDPSADFACGALVTSHFGDDTTS